MIVRPFTFLTFMLFALSGAYLFVVKHQSQALEDQLEQTAESSRQNEQAIRVLQAQWALEADPSRIATLAAQFTGLQPMKPGQLVTIASLTSSLPAAGSAAPFSNPQDEVPAMPGAGAAPVTPSGPPIEVKGHLASAAPATKPALSAAAMQVADNNAAAAAPAVTPVVHHTTRPRATARPEARLASAESALRDLPAVSRPARLVSQPSAIYEAAATPPAPVTRQASALPMGAQVVRVRADAVAPAPVAQTVAPLGGGSLLGMAQSGSPN